MSGTERASVLVVGAGPVGLMLTGELRLGGVDVVLVERLAEPTGESRGLGFTARTTEILHQRGLLERMGDPEISPKGHFGGMPLDFSVLEGSHFGVRNISQSRVEAVLQEWAISLGADVRRGTTLVALEDDGDGVMAELDGPAGRYTLRCDYLVGCDGGKSTVRGLAGFEFPGTDASREMFLADVVGRNIKPRFTGERVPGGMVMSAPLGEGIDRIIVCERGAPPQRRTAPVPWSEVAAAWERLTGEDLSDAETTWVSAFSDASRLVTAYQRGRVLLAGDAAHIHLPAGGQGMSVGIQDAVNLGWKLAGTLAGWAPAGLLATYNSERRPVGARVLRNTRAQGLLYLGGAEVEPLRAVFSRLMTRTPVGQYLSATVAGLDIRYDVGPGEHPLLGRRLRDVPLHGGVSTAKLLEPGRGVLVGDTTFLRELAAPWADRVDIVDAPPEGAGWPKDTGALLLRPDGYVAWAAPSEVPLTAALERWFGAPASPGTDGPDLAVSASHS